MINVVYVKEILIIYKLFTKNKKKTKNNSSELSFSSISDK